MSPGGIKNWNMIQIHLKPIINSEYCSATFTAAHNGGADDSRIIQLELQSIRSSHSHWQCKHSYDANFKK